jgi:O-antigen ligase
LIKYYREYGVDYDYWTGELYNVGIGVNKNGLGRLCLIAGLFCLSDMLVSWQAKNSRSKYINLLIGAFVMSLTLWLLLLSNSATSATSLFAGSAVILLLGLRVVRTHAKNLGIIAMLAIGAFLALGLSFNLIETAVLGLGKNMTLTSRTPLWSELWNLGTNPVLGVGYDSFWLGERLDRIINQFNVNEAHNGYLEVYLELGVIGLLLLMGFVLSVFRKAKQSLQHESSFDFGRLQVAMVVIFLLYNVTESAYKATTLMFFALLLVGISVPRSLRSPRLQQASRTQAGDARLPRMPVSGETRKGGPA